ncbi:TDG [Cordylochernes scorpioides]|uniref:TDG n=1 Tax=Cordylochernes scorpioides TaxID=51811 RepID=A0ABY6KEZ3_9ARAC|nr:TDG [Cordylochernes scorpioides]
MLSIEVCNHCVCSADRSGNAPLTETFKAKKKKIDRFNGATEEEVLTKFLPDHLAESLDILIVGINPGLVAAHVGHHYAGPGNHFWQCMYLSGLIPSPMTAYDDFKLLEMGIGFTNMVARTTRSSADLTSVVMKSNREFENRAAIIVALRAGRSPKEIVDFLKLPKTTIYRVKKQFDEADSNKEGIATRKKHSRRSDRVRGEEFVKNVKEKIDGNPGKSMRAIAKEMDVGSMTIVRTIHEDLGLKSYALRKGQLLTENMKNNRKGKAAALLNNLKHDSFGMRAKNTKEEIDGGPEESMKTIVKKMGIDPMTIVRSPMSLERLVAD